MRHGFVGDIDADRIELTAGQVGKTERVAHHRIHVRAKAALLLNVGGRIILGEDAPLPVNGG